MPVPVVTQKNIKFWLTFSAFAWTDSTWTPIKIACPAINFVKYALVAKAINVVTASLFNNSPYKELHANVISAISFQNLNSFANLAIKLV